MKKIFFLTLIILFSTNIKAQNKIRLGVSGGAHLNYMISEYFIDQSDKIGIELGFILEIPITPKISIQPEILYSRQGTKTKVRTTGPFPTYDYKLDYIQVPILTNLILKNHLTIELGPSFNFLINSVEYRGELPDFIINGEVVPQQKYFYGVGKCCEISGIFGLKYRLENGIFGRLSYNQGFSLALKDLALDARNRTFRLGLGYMF